MNSLTSTLVLALVAICVAGAGYYLTEVKQPAELQAIEELDRVARLQHAEVEQLLVEQAATAELAETTLRKWKARYKIVPAKMETPDIVQYLEGLSSRGFEEFNIQLVGVTKKPDFSQYTFKISGTAFFLNLHDFVWHLENNREFYHVRNLSLRHQDVMDENPNTGVERRLDMVGFSMDLDAFFSGVEGLSAPKDSLMPVPRTLLPAHYPAHNSFYPLVRAALPPNDELLVNVEEAKLISILGGKAVFEDKNGQHVLSEGDAVYLGQVVKIDPVNVLVRVSLNKGGVTQVLDLKLDMEQERYRQAQGGVRLSPIENDN